MTESVASLPPSVGFWLGVVGMAGASGVVLGYIICRYQLASKVGDPHPLILVSAPSASAVAIIYMLQLHGCMCACVCVCVCVCAPTACTSLQVCVFLYMPFMLPKDAKKSRPRVAADIIKETLSQPFLAPSSVCVCVCV